MDLTKKVSDREILKKFKRGNSIENENEVRVLEKYANTGWVSFGFNYRTQKADASLTPYGIELLRQMC